MEGFTPTHRYGDISSRTRKRRDTSSMNDTGNRYKRIRNRSETCPSGPDPIVSDEHGLLSQTRQHPQKVTDSPEVVIISSDEDDISVKVQRQRDRATDPPKVIAISSDKENAGTSHRVSTSTGNAKRWRLERRRREFSLPAAAFTTGNIQIIPEYQSGPSTSVPIPQYPLASPTPYRSVQSVAGKRWVVVLGAGINTPAGIPDFLSRKDLRSIFDAAILSTPGLLKEYLSEIAAFQTKSDSASPTTAHKFVAQLKSTGKLIRAYTQNIDGLEGKAGLTCGFDASDACIQLHGSVQALRCSLCSSRPSLSTLHPGDQCTRCEIRAEKRASDGKRRCSTGIVLPDIRLYNEHHPDGDSVAEAIADDLERRPDVLLIMGTRLSIPGIKDLVRVVGNAVRANGGRVIMVNRTGPPSIFRDLVEWIATDCDAWASACTL